MNRYPHGEDILKKNKDFYIIQFLKENLDK